jgi:RNA polymerase sigma-70 factor (ECF subfamily)
MADPSSFQDLIQRVRNRDEAAAAELVQRYEGSIRRVVRYQLHDRRLRRVFDSMDVCQSVLATFFRRVADGQFDLDHAEQLIQLLVRIAYNKVAQQARRQYTKRRDVRRLEGAQFFADEKAGPAREPSDQLAVSELLERFHERLSEEEWQLATERAAGRAWPEIAAELGGSSEALRKRLARGVERVERQLHLDESTDG